MPGEDQERFEDYLELERFIAELQAGRASYPPQELTPTQARVYRMALLFHAATPEAGEPGVEFAAQLQSRLEQELQTLEEEPTAVEAQAATPIPKVLKPKRRLARRWLLAGSVSAAASLMVGAGVHAADMAMFHRAFQAATVTSTPTGILLKLDSLMEWFPVTTVDELGNQAIKFKAEDQSGSLCLTGYVVRSDGTNGDPAEKDQIIAMSAACTHKGCIVDWSSSDRSFHCPCHGGVFTEDGGTHAGASSLYLNPLPRLEVHLDNGQIYVRMPAS
ncbi:MAG TPA: Rieske 2Fe-2S domain-containing protein [Ktedonobacteraceae bacterium]|nr:Rieske 2Fe-2S domain-containing protein [Ktedonobacteraceae bacterium]